MNEVKIITAFTPPEQEPHISAEDDAAIYQGLVGTDGVLNVGKCLKCEVTSNNKVKILDGAFEINGHFARIPHGGYVEATITNGSGNMNRHDIVVAVLRKNAVTGDKVTIEVKRGTPVNGEALDPELIQEDVYSGGKTRELPLYKVVLKGINIKEVTPMFEIRPSLLEINKLIKDSYENLDEYFTPTSAWTVNRFHAFRQGNVVHINFMISTASWQPDTGYTCFKSTLPKRLCPGGGNPSEVNPYNYSVIDVGGNGSGSLKNARVCTFTVSAQDGSIGVNTPTEPWEQVRGNYFWAEISYSCKGSE